MAYIGWLYSYTNERFQKIYPEKEFQNVKPVLPRLSGFIERAAFAPAFVLAPAEAATGVFAWMALKLAANWQMSPAENEDGEDRRIHRQQSARSLLLGFLSLSIAAASGWFFRWLCTHPH